MESVSLLRMPQVRERTGFKKSHIYALIRERKFPRPVKVGPRASAWNSSDIDAWIAGKLAAKGAA